MRLNGRMRNLPFGGSQVICIGDLYQLPPVISTKEEKQLLEYLYETPFFYSAHVLKEVNFNYIELKKIYRQTDGHFLNLLCCLNRDIIRNLNRPKILVTLC
jgi:hypothetical protein